LLQLAGQRFQLILRSDAARRRDVDRRRETVRNIAAGLPLIEVQEELPAWLGELVPQAQKQSPPLDDDSRVGQWPINLGQEPRKLRQSSIDHLQRTAVRQQLGKPAGDGNLGKVEMAQPLDDLYRAKRSLPFPPSNRRHRNVEQLRQHRRRVEPLHSGGVGVA
jgi:hypothetical protein